jgi:hypothetical protein
MNTPTRLLLLLICATVLASCADQSDTAPGDQMRQEAHTNPMGQTTYTYRKVDPQ